MKTHIVKFLKSNGYKRSKDYGKDEYLHYHKSGCYDIDISKDEIVLIDETGDFMHIKMNTHAHYTLLGVLLHYCQITIGYNWHTYIP